jgi:hypothetical protein
MQRPSQLHPWADEILQALAGHPESHEIVLGGYFALQHFLDYRKTNDIDAWWRDRANPETLKVLHAVMEEFAQHHDCTLQERQFGETYSFELVEHRNKVYTVQIAVRSAEIEPPVPSLWPPIMIETLRDNIGAKMNALVERGAPRDFTDIQKVVEAGIFTIAECWSLWSQKNDNAAIGPAKQKVLFHLTSLAARRPLDSIADSSARKGARERREWYKNEFFES